MICSNSILGGLVLASTAALFTAQGASEPMKSAPGYFVTAESDSAHLCVREGKVLRVVGHGACKGGLLDSEHEHREAGGHDHDAPDGEN